MKRLKIILQSKFIYLFLFFIAIISYFVASNLEHVSSFSEFKDEKFIITNIIFKDYGIRLDLKGKEKVIGYLYYDEEAKNEFIKSFELGDEVLVSGDISEINNNTVPDTFNYKRYLYSNKIYNVIEITSISKISDNKSVFYLIKNKLLERGKRLDKSYPYISSLIFGNNSYLDEDVLSSYRENGISHLFAISGLHISVFIMIISFLLDKIRVNNILKSLILVFFLLFYMFLTNFSMSVLRAGIFTILLVFNKLFKLEIPSINLLLLTFVIIVVNNPLNLNNVGFQYSFLVTLFLILFSNLFNKKGKIYSLFMVSLVAFLVSYPITINNFNQVNFLSVIYNLFFVPYVSSILLPFTLICYIFPFLDSCLYFFIQIIESLSHFFNSISIFKVSMCKMHVLMIVSYFVVICQLFLKWNKSKKKYLFFVILFFILHYFMPFKSNDYVMFFDVGQGDSALVNVKGNITLIDTGGLVMYSDKEYTYKLSKNRILPYLKAKGIRKIDNLILTHGDADHMKEAKYLIENFKVEKVIFNCGEYNDLEKELIEVLETKSIKYKSCINKLAIGSTEFKFLNTDIYDNENDNSSVVYFNYEGYKFLFMGDAGLEKEKDILEKYNLKAIDFLKVGHHGSNTSSSKEFIDKVNPKYSLISVGKNNRFGHPKDTVLNTLSNSTIYRTDLDGSVIFELKNNKLKIETYSP
ncbi:MAG: DNA internalization-related competence protein ComEC/Rec2 [Bacilli bacterium]